MTVKWKDKNVFITGCTGFLGSWLTKDLVDKGANVVGLIRDWVPASNLVLQETINKIITVRGDVRDFSAIRRCLNEYDIDTVLHLAAQPIVSIANKDPISTFEININGTWNILEACRASMPNVKNIVIASSDKAYGEHRELPYDENTPIIASYPYDVSKSCADLIAQTYYKTYGLGVCITRCANFYGGGDLNFNRIVPGTIRSVLRNEHPIIRSDGLYIRDYIYIKDAVNAYRILVEKMESEDRKENNIYGEAFNFSNDMQLTVLDLTNKILQIMQREDLVPVVLNEAKGEITCQYLSSAKARDILGWSVKYTLDDGLTETIDWYRNFFKNQKEFIVKKED